LEEDPKRDVKKLFDDLLEAGNLLKNPYPDQKANLAYNEALNISVEAKEEFQRVYELLGNKSNPEIIIEKIKNKFGAKVELQLSLKNFIGWEKQLIRAVQSGDITSINLVLEKLGYGIEPDPENAKKGVIKRPPLEPNSEVVQLTYVGNHDLMRLAKSEQLIIREHFENIAKDGDN
jgi:hypothetical protein